MMYRLLGVVAVLAGLAAGWFWVLGPLRAAQAGAAEVSYDLNTFMITPLAIVIGLLLIVGGEKVVGIVHGTPTNAKDWIYRIAMIAVVGGVAWLSWTWFSGQMTALGYSEVQS
ncbi:MAG: hypothetical protein ABL897_13435 [Hyphomicrobium sp.]